MELRIFGITFNLPWRPRASSQAVAAHSEQREEKAYDISPVSGGGWWPLVRESFSGAWQRGIVVRPETVLSYHAVFACVTRISSDVAKLRIKLVSQDENRIWSEITNSTFSPVLRKPNRFQTRIQFIEQWLLSKLIYGNAYILKQRDAGNVVRAMYVLNPLLVKPLVAPDGSVYYQLGVDQLSGLLEAVAAVPASEIIHDRMNCFFHPLVGISPIFASGLSASQGLSIQRNSTSFFSNGARPAGFLTAPDFINDETAKRLKTDWEANYTGENVGRTAVLGNGLKYEQLTMNAVDAELIKQLQMTAEQVCSTFHVPTFMVGVGPAPAYNNVGALNQQYYTQCLQTYLESVELCLDEGLGLPDVRGSTYGTEFDLDGLLRMDSLTQAEAASKLTGAGIMKIDEARAKFDLAPTPGGDTPYLQVQNYSLAALAKRDAKEDPFAKAEPSANDNAAAATVAARAAIQRRWGKVTISGL